MPDYDAVVVGAGPNGLAAAIVLAQAGMSVLIIEAKPTIGGGTRSAELTLPGYIHDVCSAFHPLGLGGPFLSTLPLDKHGLSWIQPPVPLAHPLDDGRTAILDRSIETTAGALGRDAAAYRRLFRPLVAGWDDLSGDILGPLIRWPQHPLLMAQFGLSAIWPAKRLAEGLFRDAPARAILAGLAAHSFLPLSDILTASFGLVLGTLGHAVGWPIARGGSQKIVDAMADYFLTLGGKIITDTPVTTIDELPSAQAILFDVTPHQLAKMAGHRLPDNYRRKLERYRYGPGVFKVDYALDGPIPWKLVDCARAGTVHLGGTLAEIAASEWAIAHGKIPEKPFVLIGQQSLFDPTRAPEGKHTVWAYCHIPNGSTVDMAERIENQIERSAPGFKDRVLAKHTFSPADMMRYNANYIGGDINGGIQDWRQLFTRPTLRLAPYSTPTKGIYLCSSSTPPGGGVHGM
ncbi:MAG: phytoene desaturase family protein, partial [Aggregatilineales bacterium]